MHIIWRDLYFTKINSTCHYFDPLQRVPASVFISSPFYSPSQEPLCTSSHILTMISCEIQDLSWTTRPSETQFNLQTPFLPFSPVLILQTAHRLGHEGPNLFLSESFCNFWSLHVEISSSWVFTGFKGQCHVTSSEKPLHYLKNVHLSHTSHKALSHKAFSFPHKICHFRILLFSCLLSSMKCKLHRSRDLSLVLVYTIHTEIGWMKNWLKCFIKLVSWCTIITFLNPLLCALSFIWKAVHLLLVKPCCSLNPVQLLHHVSRIPFLTASGWAK